MASLDLGMCIEALLFSRMSQFSRHVESNTNGASISYAIAEKHRQFLLFSKGF